MVKYTTRYVDPTFARKCSTSPEYDPRKMQTLFDLAEPSRHPYVTIGEVSYLFYGDDDEDEHNPGGFHTPLRPQRARPAAQPAAEDDENGEACTPLKRSGLPAPSGLAKRPRLDLSNAERAQSGEEHHSDPWGDKNNNMEAVSS